MIPLRVCYRVDHHGHHDLEFDLSADTTIGEVAQLALSHLPAPNELRRPTLNHEGRVLGGELLALDYAPRSGATVSLAQDVGARSMTPLNAPVFVVSGDERTQLDYGLNRVIHGAMIEVGSTITVKAIGGSRVTVNGQVVRGAAPAGDRTLIRSNSTSATIEQTAMLMPPNRGPVSIHGSTPAAVRQPDAVEVELPQPPARERLPGFPVLSASVPLLMGAAMWAFTRSLWSVGFMAFTFVYVLASGVESRREAKREHAFREQEFHQELESTRDRLTDIGIATELGDDTAHPGGQELISWFEPLSERVWERTPTHPLPLEVRLGRSSQQSGIVIGPPKSGRPDLLRMACEVGNVHRLQCRPLTVDLADVGDLTIAGSVERGEALLRSVLFQLAVLCPPSVVGFDIQQWNHPWPFLRWLPNNADADWTIRVGSPPSSGRPTGTIDLRLTPGPAALADDPSATIRLRPDGSSWLHIGHHEAVRFEPEALSNSAVENPARELSALRSVGAQRIAESSVSDLTLSDIGVDRSPSGLTASWAQPPEGLSAPLGRLADGSTLLVDLIADGPHALVAGTTGSGKSELLRTWMASLASRYSAEELNFIFIDYKGGAAFGALRQLPHCVGLVTDLRAGGAHRALVSLRAELQRRERCLASHGASSLTEVPKPYRPARTLLVIDEFATLASEVPDFLEGVLDVAQRGRSLGFHMILATQRPAGVISDSIRANTSLRIALRLPDADDSIDVVGDPAASRLARDAPGHAVIRFGHEEILSARMAHSGAPDGSISAPPVRDLGQPRTMSRDSVSGSALESLVAEIARTHRKLEFGEPHRPWTEPLPRQLGFEDLLNEKPANEKPVDPLVLPLGLIDLMEEQRRDTFVVDFRRRGGFLVAGASTSGRSTTLASLIWAASESDSWDLHLIDSRGSDQHILAGDRLTGWMKGTDHESVHRLLNALIHRLGQPRPDSGSRRVLLLVDGMGEFCEQQERINGGRAVDMVSRLAAEGAANDIHVAVSASRRADLPHQLAHLLGNRLLHRFNDVDEPLNWDAPGELAEPDLPSGRAWSCEHWVQVAIPPVEPTAPTACARLAERVTRGVSTGTSAVTQSPDHSGRQRWSLPLGIASTLLNTAFLDLSRQHALVIGSRGTGRTTTLWTIAESARRAGIEVLRVSAESQGALTDLAGRHAAGITNPARLLILDDIEEWIEEPGADEALCDLIRNSRKSNLRVVAAAERASVQRSFADSVLKLRHGRTAVLLGPQPEELGSIVDTDIARRDDIRWPLGRGILVSGGTHEVIQVALTVRDESTSC